MYIIPNQNTNKATQSTAKSTTTRKMVSSNTLHFTIGDPRLKINKSEFNCSELINVYGPKEQINAKKLLVHGTNTYYALEISKNEITINYLILETFSTKQKQTTENQYHLLNNNPEVSGHSFLEPWVGDTTYDFIEVPASLMYLPTIRMVDYDAKHNVFFWNKDTKLYEKSQEYMFHPFLESVMAPKRIVLEDIVESEMRHQEEADYYGETYQVYNDF